MGRTTIELDEAACAIVMRRFGLSSKRDAVNRALEVAATLPMSDEEIRLDLERQRLRPEVAAAIESGRADLATGRVVSVETVRERLIPSAAQPSSAQGLTTPGDSQAT